MMKLLHKNAQHIQNILLQNDISTEVIEFAVTTRTAQDAAQAIGCEVGQIVKSLIFRTKSNHTPMLVLASGANRVNEHILEQQIGEPLEKADAHFTREVTGFAIGGIPPIGHKQMIKTFIDRDLTQFQTLWAAAGTPNAVFSMKATDLPLLTQGTIIDIQ